MGDEMGPVKKQQKRASGSSATTAASTSPTSTSPVKTESIESGGHPEDMDDQDYLNKRARNNDAVKRSRAKAKAKITETHDRVTVLKKENQNLEGKIKLLSKELAFLKDIFMAHAGHDPAFKAMIPQFLSITKTNSLPVNKKVAATAAGSADSRFGQVQQHLMY